MHHSTNHNGHQANGRDLIRVPPRPGRIPLDQWLPDPTNTPFPDWLYNATPVQLEGLYRETQTYGRQMIQQGHRVEDLEDEVRRLREALQAQGVTLDASPGYESSLQAKLTEARAEVRALSNAALGRTALTLVTIIKLYAENEKLPRLLGAPDDRGWITIWNNQILKRLSAAGRGSENRLRKDVELGVAMGVIEKRLLQTTGTKPGEDGKAKRSVKTECQYRLSANVAELFSMIATYAGPGESRGSAPGEHRGAAKPDAKRCPKCRRVLGRNHAHRDTNP